MMQQSRDGKHTSSHLIDGDEWRTNNDKLTGAGNSTGASEERLILQCFDALADALRHPLGVLGRPSRKELLGVGDVLQGKLGPLNAHASPSDVRR